jgi:hypothetical protein
VACGAPHEHGEQVAQRDGDERELEHVGHGEQNTRADDGAVVLPRWRYSTQAPLSTPRETGRCTQGDR